MTKPYQKPSRRASKAMGWGGYVGTEPGTGKYMGRAALMLHHSKGLGGAAVASQSVEINALASVATRSCRFPARTPCSLPPMLLASCRDAPCPLPHTSVKLTASKNAKHLSSAVVVAASDGFKRPFAKI
jgi:hypothetical protein